MLSISDEHVSQPDMQVGLSFSVRKLYVPTLKLMRNLTGSQCNRFRIGTERLKHDETQSTIADISQPGYSFFSPSEMCLDLARLTLHRTWRVLCTHILAESCT